MVGFGTLEFVLVTVFLSSGVLLFFAWNNERAVANRTVDLKNEYIGTLVVVDAPFLEEKGQFRGTVHIGNESWSAISNEPILSGESVRVSGRDGLMLYVDKGV